MEDCGPEMEESLPEGVQAQSTVRNTAPEPGTETGGSAPQSSSVTTEFPEPRKPPIKLQMMQHRESMRTASPVERIGSGGQIHRRTSSSSISGDNDKPRSSQTSATKPKVEKKFDLKGVPKDELLAEIDLRWKRLSGKEDLTVEVADDLEYFCDCAKLPDRNVRKELVKKMHDLGLIKLIKDIWAQNFPAFAAEEESISAYTNMKFIMVVVWNTTDMLDETCQKILDSNFYQDMYKSYLDSYKMSPASKKSVKKAYLTKGLMGILHNMLQRVEAREPMREVNAVEILAKFRDSANDLIQTKAEILLAYLIDEKQNAEFNSDDKTFVYLIKVLKECLNDGNKEHYSKRYGYEARELVAALNKLSVNDLNKDKIIKNGALPLVVSMMKPESTAAEQLHSSSLIWNLSFHQSARKAVIDEPGCISAMQELLTKGANQSVKRTAFGALWTLKVPPKRKESDIVEEKVKSNEADLLYIDDKKPMHEIPEVPGQDDLDPESPHIFISYNWGSKPTMLKVRDKLKSLGYNVWMDVDDMSGSILEAMATAVEKAAVVVVCLSQKYKESPNCRTEGEYAFRVRKPIVPLRLESKYIADGWLGALVGNKLFFDISTGDKLQQNFNPFIRELGERGILRRKGGAPAVIVPEQSHDLALPPKNPSSPQHPTLGPTCKAENWDRLEVQKWLKKNEMDQYLTRFEEFDGKMLAEYKAILVNAPEFFFKSLKEDLDFSLPTLLKFTRALKDLD